MKTISDYMKEQCKQVAAEYKATTGKELTHKTYDIATDAQNEADEYNKTIASALKNTEPGDSIIMAGDKVL